MTQYAHLNNVTVGKTRIVEFHEPLSNGIFTAVVVTAIVVGLILAAVFVVSWVARRMDAR